MQILGRPFPTQAAHPGKPEKREFEYIRLGTRAMITTFVVATGEVVWDLGPTRTNLDFRTHVLGGFRYLSLDETFTLTQPSLVLPGGATDFNDLHQLAGPAAVRAGIERASPIEVGAIATATVATTATDWLEPQPLDRKAAEPEPYPLDALHGVIGAAVREYQAYGQQPMALVGSSALAVVSLARVWRTSRAMSGCAGRFR